MFPELNRVGTLDNLVVELQIYIFYEHSNNTFSCAVIAIRNDTKLSAFIKILFELRTDCLDVCLRNAFLNRHVTEEIRNTVCSVD